MAQLGSVVGIAVKAFTVSGKKNECSIASARSNSFCASGEHEVLKCTRPSFSGLPVRGSLSAHTGPTKLKDTTSAAMNLAGLLLMTPSLGIGPHPLRRLGRKILAQLPSVPTPALFS